jgi:hypothetical protein
LLAASFATPLPSLAGNKKTAVTVAGPPAASKAKGAGIVTFCAKNRGKKVGDGECWALANEAFKQTGARRPGSDTRVWGRRLNLKKESLQPGDILECEQTRFADGSYVPTKHTAVIVGVRSGLLVRLAEQNFAGKKKVTERDVDLNGVRSGRIFVYRP